MSAGALNYCCLPSGRQHTILDVACVNSCPVLLPSYVQPTRSRFVKFCVCLSVCRRYVIHIWARKLLKLPRYLRYHAAFDTRWFSFSKFFLDRKFPVRTIHHIFTFLWKYSSTHQGFINSFINSSRPVSRKAVLFHEFISAVNSTNYSSYRVELEVQEDNIYLNAFNNDLILREGFLTLNNLSTVVCCPHILRLFMSTGLRFCAFLVDRFMH